MERWDSRGEVAVLDENVDVTDLGERPALSRVVHTPLENVVATTRGQLFAAKAEQRRHRGRQNGTHSANPILRKRSTAPLPHRPSAPMTSALTSLMFRPDAVNLPLTSLTMLPSLGYGSNEPIFSSEPSFLAANASKPAAAPAKPAWKPKAATRRPWSSVRNSRSYRVPPPRANRESTSTQPD